jgi:anaerobic magnesium-protoporphyrin IX monomethyl ester cyclase
MKIVLSTLHAKYVHSSLALPCLASVCSAISGVDTVIREFTVNEPADRVLRSLVAAEADVVAFSCYIWNIGETLKLAADLKAVRPQTFIILGGPEASFGVFELLERNRAVDCVVRGEGEETFRELAALLRERLHTDPEVRGLDEIPGMTCRAGADIIATPDRPPLASLDAIPSPFAAGFADLEKPLVYCETSRGCPFSCAFCMSSLEQGVRSFSMARVKSDLSLLMAKEVHTVKLVDRTFNYDAPRANEIWRFILAENRTSRFHFEIAADLLTEENIALLREVPAGAFRFEIGVQSGEAGTLARVGRKTELARLFANVRRLREETGVVLHLDLVAGLPGEDFPGFLRSLQQLFDVLGFGSGGAYRAPAGAPPAHFTEPRCHIQVEPLKVLKGSPIRRIADAENYAYSAAPPYKILRTPWLSFAEICRIETIGRLLDLIFNGGKFRTFLAAVGTALPLSDFFAAAAAYWEEAELPPHLSQSALFDAAWRFTNDFMQEPQREAFRDALTFDFCLADYPAAGRCPDFFGDEGKQEQKGREREEIASLAQRLGIAAGSRIRTFSRSFARDYRSTPWGEGQVELKFVYISAPGKGLEVKVLEF